MINAEVMQSPLLLQAIHVTARDATLALPSLELAERIFSKLVGRWTSA